MALPQATSVPISSDGGSTPQAQQRTYSINADDPIVRMAVHALGDMRNERISPGQSHMTSPTSPYTSPNDTSAGSSYSSYALAQPGQEYTPPETAPDGTQGSSGPDFVSRVSSFPIVNTALQVYERGKSSSRVVKYGAEMVESSVRSMSKPVIDRLPVAQMDDFACRQLDRLEGRRRSFSQSQSYAHATEAPQGDWEVNTPTSMKQMYSQHPNVSTLSLQTQATYSTVDGSITSNMPPLTPSTTRGDVEFSPQPQGVQQSSRGGWQTMLVGAGGLGVAMSDNMQRLQYCLGWLKWGTEVSERQITILRNFLASLSIAPPSPQPNSRTYDPEMTPISPRAARTLADAQKEVVETIKQVVDIVSTRTGSALTEPSRIKVRRWILELPQRWRARAVREQEQADAAALYPRGSYARQGQPPPPQTIVSEEGGLPTVGAAKSIATKVLTLAMESLDMLQAVTKVFNESLESAEGWINRFQAVGLRPEDNASQQQQPPNAAARQQPPQTPSNMSSQANTPGTHTAPYGSYPWSTSTTSIESGKQDYVYYGYAPSSGGQQMTYMYSTEDREQER